MILNFFMGDEKPCSQALQDGSAVAVLSLLNDHVAAERFVHCLQTRNAVWSFLMVKQMYLVFFIF